LTLTRHLLSDGGVAIQSKMLMYCRVRSVFGSNRRLDAYINLFRSDM
jgi:hypothetical protein